MATYSATSLVIEKSSARAAPAARSRSASARSVSARAIALASAVAIAGLDEQGVHSVGGDVAVAIERTGDDSRPGGHGLDQHDPEGLAVQ